ncbi:PASTA domain-containing protein [Streptomyces sp. NPDC006622]|uniref:PASTA domain-containing protein n=1 Tax=Streptomyces sp. NPDC006622 TaxID=3155459 RepID=UPI0033AB7F72
MSQQYSQPYPPQQPGWVPPPPKKPVGKIVGLGCLGIIGLFIVLGAIGSAVGGSTDDSNSSSSVQESSASAATPAAPTTPSSKSDTGDDGDKGDGGGNLPNFAGKGLQSAQDQAQEAGFYNLTSHDSLGRGRMQALDRNWKVCSQIPAPGKHSTDTKVDFGTVKLQEDCPAKDQGTLKEAGSTMPNFVGKSVKVARQALDSSTSITVTDGSGDDRFILMESNWKVCSQDPKAGTKLDGQPVALTAVKFEESC